jgi:hypothetical protein
MNADYCILSTRLLPLYDDLADGLSLCLGLRYSHEVDPVRHELAMLIPSAQVTETRSPGGRPAWQPPALLAATEVSQ